MFNSLRRKLSKKDSKTKKIASENVKDDREGAAVKDKRESSVEEVMVHRLTNDPDSAWSEMRLEYSIKSIDIPRDLGAVSDKKLRFVCISDTHTFFEDQETVKVPDGDVLLHCGDFCLYGEFSEVRKFNNFMGKQPHRYKVVIGGNHDQIFDKRLASPKTKEYLIKYQGVKEVSGLLSHCTYVEDEMIQIAGINIYGTPWIPTYGSTCFSLERGEELLEKWNKIPTNTTVDILMTHAPPLGAGDLVKAGRHVGCVELINVVQKRVRPVYHVFGHIHEGYGMYTDGTTTFINASSCNRKYQVVNQPVVFDLDIPQGHKKTDPLIRLWSEEKS